MAIVKVRTNSNYVDLIDNASLSQGSASEEAHLWGQHHDGYSEDYH